ncbi:MAG: IS66 family transposase [Nitrososphaerales archaeon]
MSASRKILASQSKKQKRHGSAKGSAEAATLGAENAELNREILFHKEEAIKLFNQLKFWREQCEGGEELTEEGHWRRRYAVRHIEAQKLEGQVALLQTKISELGKELADKNAQIQRLKRDIFNRSSEQGALDGSELDDSSAVPSSPAAPDPVESQPKRNRGGQPGTPRTGPRHHDNLPIGEEADYELSESCCADCGEQWTEVSTQESEEVEVSVRAYRRKHRRKKYGHHCKKKGHWVTKTAAGPKRLFPHSTYGISFWVFLLVGRYVLQIAVNRLRLLLREKNLPVSQGTITAGFKRIRKLIKPLITEIRRYSREEKHHWHIDDTGWKVFVLIEGKEGFGWYLWVFLSQDVCVFILSPSRARAVPQSHLKNSCGVVTSDRLASNKKLGDLVDNSYCWVHERREFRNLAQGYPELARTCHHFLKLIGSLFYYNKQRLLSDPDTSQFQDLQAKLKNTLGEILERCQTELTKTNLHPELRRVFTGIVKDWDGLYMFFDLPAVPPDNNPAERALRGPVVSRKNCYGSGSKWSAEFLADMYSLVQTLQLNNINVENFLTDYLAACADNDGKPPRDAKDFLPWNQRPPPSK